MITKLIFSGTNLTLTFDTGELYMGSCRLEQAQQIALNDALTLDEVRAFLEPEYSKVLEENKESKQLVETVLSDDRFYYAEGSLYRVGIPLSIPKHLAEDIAECLTKIQDANKNLDDVEAFQWSNSLETLDNFWQWTSLIRYPDVRESFYTFCQKNTMVITPQGIVLGVRKANYKGTNPELVEFVTKEFLRLRANKKSTNVQVYQDYEGYTLKETDEYKNYNDEIGILKDLYNNLGETDYFESATSGTSGKVQFRIGQEARLPENEVDWNPTNECSRGLHGHCALYNDGRYGDVRFIFAVNPMDIASCPYSDGTKFRMAALTPVVLLNKGESFKDFKLTSEVGAIIDEMFINHVNNLSDMLAKGDFKEFSKHKLVKDLHFTSILNTIVSENKELVKDRYVKL